MKSRIVAIGIVAVMTSQAGAADFMVTSPQLEDGGGLRNEQVLNGFGCSGLNMSPELNWHGEPEGTKSFAVTVYDPDAPTGSGWWHWVVFNIPSDQRRLAPNSGDVTVGVAPDGAVQSRTDFGAPGYGGACPPAGDGDHRYQFRVWALDVAQLDLSDQVSGAMVGYFLNQHKLAQAEITVTYGR